MRWHWLYLGSVLIAGVWEALLNAPSGYAPILCGSDYKDVPCVSYSWLDSWPQWASALMWFAGIAFNVTFLVLLFKCGTLRQILHAVWGLCVLIVLSAAFISVHHWHMIVIDLGVTVDDSALHRWDILGLIHNACEYAILPLSIAGLVWLAPTWYVRRRRERQAVSDTEAVAVTS